MGKKLGDKIKEARNYADMTQEQLAREVSGLSVDALKAIERGEKEPTTAQIKAIAEAAGVAAKPLLELAAKDSAGSTSLSDEELKLVRLYRKASAAKKKSVMEILKQDSGSDLEDLIQNIMSGLTGTGSGSNSSGKDDTLTQILENAMNAFGRK